MNHNDKLLNRLNNQTSFSKIICDGLKFQTKVDILGWVDKRVFNNISQISVAKTCGVGISKIKAFEQLKVSDLELYQNYKYLFDELPNKTRRKSKRYHRTNYY